ncbi:hypothetical protein [Desulfoluna sp.]|uniref:hypothetical protein n=1 Tax=Desulfoluna sp. TaxID=2045199 RepID=UPI002623B7B9|nr:hypothetical protein [Desulfoluna sp.]
MIASLGGFLILLQPHAGHLVLKKHLGGSGMGCPLAFIEIIFKGEMIHLMTSQFLDTF